jgi:hypothetical protein
VSLAAFIISIIALGVALMTLPTVAQMVWGKPRLIITFDSREVEGGKVMTCQFSNPPITEGFKKKIGVRRMPIEDLMADFSIAEYGSNKVIYPGHVPYILRHDGVINAQRINLPASIFPAHFGVAAVSYDTKTVKVFDKNTDLPVGKYIVKVSAAFQENENEAEGILIVHGEYPYAYWA